MTIALKCDLCGILFEQYRCEKEERSEPNCVGLFNSVISADSSLISIATITCCPECMQRIEIALGECRRSRR